MSSPFKLIIEDIVFGPLLFLFLWLFSLLLMFRHRQQFRLPFRLLVVGWLVLLLGSNTLFFQFMAYPLKLLTPKSEVRRSDVIVVASAGVHESGAPTFGSTLRAYAAAKLYLNQRAPLVLVTGGVTHPYQPPVSIKGMAIILQGMGVPAESIIIENRSTDTYMNGEESVKILKKRNLKTILLVSHDYHLFRLVSVFRKLGIETYPYAANQAYPKTEIPWWRYFDWENFSRLQTVAHEYIGLVTYKLAEKI